MSNLTEQLQQTLQMLGELEAEISKNEKSMGLLKQKNDQLSTSYAFIQKSLQKLNEEQKKNDGLTAGQARGYADLKAQQTSIAASYQKNKKKIEELNAAIIVHKKEYKSTSLAIKGIAKDNDELLGTYDRLKLKQKTLQEAMKSLNLESEEGKAKFNEYRIELANTTKSLDKLNKSIKEPKTLKVELGDGIKNLKKGFTDVAAGLSSLNQISKDLHLDEVFPASVNERIEQVGDLVKSASIAMQAYNAVLKVGQGLTTAFNAAKAIWTTVTALQTAGTGGLTIAQWALNVAMAANPIGIIVAGFTALLAVGAAVISFFFGGESAAESMNKALEKQTEVMEKNQKAAEREIAIKKAQGASAKELFELETKALQGRVDAQEKMLNRARKALKDASEDEKKEIRKKIKDIKADIAQGNHEIKLLTEEHEAAKLKLQADAAKALEDLQIENIADAEQREKAALELSQSRELAAFKEKFGALENYAQLEKELLDRMAQERADLDGTWDEENSKINQLNNSITELSNKAMRDFVETGSASQETLDELIQKTEELDRAKRKFQKATENSAYALELEMEELENQRKEINKNAELEEQIIKKSLLSEEEKTKKLNELRVATAQQQLDLYRERAKLDKKVTDEELAELNRLEQAVLNFQKVIEKQAQNNVQQEIIAQADVAAQKEADLLAFRLAEEQKNYEERLAAAGIYLDRLDELDEQGRQTYDIVTAEHNANKLAIDEEYNQELIDQRLNAVQKEVDDFNLATEILLQQQKNRQQQELNNENLSNKERRKKKKEFLDQAVQAEKDAIQEQIDVLTDGLRDLGVAGDSFDVIPPGTSEETKQRVQEMVLEIEKLKGSLASVGKDGEEEEGGNPLLKSMGMDAEGQEKFKEQFGAIQESVTSALSTISSLFEHAKDQRLAEISEEEEAKIAEVESSGASEEEKQERIAAIKEKSQKKAEAVERKFKKRQKKIDIITSIINTAVAVGKALGSAPPPANFILAALTAAQGAVQTAIIAKQKFARGGMVPFAEGGVIDGPSHAEGGVPFMSGGQMMEAEGGELIVNKNIWSRPDFVRTISSMNAVTGGQKFFASGGVIPSTANPVAAFSKTEQPGGVDTDELVGGLRGVISQEVGSLQVVNNVVDTSDQQTTLFNQQTDGSF